MKAMILVHVSDYGDGRSVRIKCTQKWHSPAWIQPPELLPGKFENATHVYATEDGHLYSFDSIHASCPQCLAEGMSP